MMEAKKEEASKLAAERQSEMSTKMNVLDINVEDDFDVDEIWLMQIILS